MFMRMLEFNLILRHHHFFSLLEWHFGSSFGNRVLLFHPLAFVIGEHFVDVLLSVGDLGHVLDLHALLESVN